MAILDNLDCIRFACWIPINQDIAPKANIANSGTRSNAYGVFSMRLSKAGRISESEPVQSAQFIRLEVYHDVFLHPAANIGPRHLMLAR